MGQDAEEFRIRLDTIAGGAAMDRFDEELSKVLANIADPNTNPEKLRSITIKITMRPNKVRDAGEVVVSSEAKLAPVKPADATVFFGKVGGRRVAVAWDPRQGGLFDAPRPTIVPLRGDAAKEGEE